MPWFRKHHTCPCGTDWWDEWDCLCNDRCPTCDAEIEPAGRFEIDDQTFIFKHDYYDNSMQ
jgi:hypothetical protein